MGRDGLLIVGMATASKRAASSYGPMLRRIPTWEGKMMNDENLKGREVEGFARNLS